MKRIIKAFGYSIDGFRSAFSSEAAFRQILFLATFGLLYAFIIVESSIYALLIIFSSLLCVIVELLNTGIEKAVDHTSKEIHPLAKVAKDVGSAAQLIAMLLWAIVFLYSWNK